MAGHGNGRAFAARRSTAAAVGQRQKREAPATGTAGAAAAAWLGVACDEMAGMFNICTIAPCPFINILLVLIVPYYAIKIYTGSVFYGA